MGKHSNGWARNSWEVGYDTLTNGRPKHLIDAGLESLTFRNDNFDLEKTLESLG